MDVPRQSALTVPILGLLSLLASFPLHAAGPAPKETAARIDAAFRRVLPPRADDERFLRRVSLDLTGKLPDPDTIQRWTADRTPEKRARLIHKLLHSDRPHARETCPPDPQTVAQRCLRHQLVALLA